MSKAKRTADKYIERGGYLPGERKTRMADDVLAVGQFIGWHHEKDVHGAVQSGEAFKAFCRIANIDPVAFRKIIRGE